MKIMEKQPKQQHEQLQGALLSALFIGFMISGLVLINVVYTIVPFSLFGQPVVITVNVGVVLLLLAAVTLILLLRG